ncbi:hypothetical protein Vretimale_19592 [Volvox reticuliferus]|uniref:Uncharacterized protein n=1 Tax=Volvox reticuliferus TaxID=1737510 RepID=A0A8J4D5D4_9CHLO|nr:hypothetical protein Vretifemale_20634 [Volvox reticuliferus]GIM17056.1 hypothetical protein Vretimale_19592 [Volvox reticuliferus]
MRRCQMRSKAALDILRKRRHVVASARHGVVEFELLPPFEGGHQESFAQVYALLTQAYPQDAKTIKNCVYRGRDVQDGVKNGSWMPSHDAFLVAGLWMPDSRTGDSGLMSAALLRVNLPKDSSHCHKKLHVQITYQATVPDLQRHGLGRLLTCCVLKAAVDAKHEFATVVMRSMAPIATKFWSMVGFRPYLDSSRCERGSNKEQLAAIMNGVMQLSRKQEAHYPIWLAKLHQLPADMHQQWDGSAGGRSMLARGLKGFEEEALSTVQEWLSDPGTVPIGASTRSFYLRVFAAKRDYGLSILHKNTSSSGVTPPASTTSAEAAAGGGSSIGWQPSTLRHIRAAAAKGCKKLLFYSDEELSPAIATVTASDAADTVAEPTPTPDEETLHAGPAAAAADDDDADDNDNDDDDEHDEHAWGLHPKQHYGPSGHVSVVKSSLTSATERTPPPLLPSDTALEAAGGSIGSARVEEVPTAAGAAAQFCLQHQLLLSDGRRQAFLVQLGCPRSSITASGSISRPPEEQLELGLQQRYLRRLRQLQQQGAREDELPPLLLNVLRELRRRRRGLRLQTQLMQQDACRIAVQD